MIRPEKHFITAVEARSIVKRHLPILQSEVIALSDSKKRILAEGIEAKSDRPAFASSGMDGFLIRPFELLRANEDFDIKGEFKAGDPITSSVEPGCYRVMTGAAIPEDCGIVPIEWARVSDETVLFEKVSTKGQFLRPAGQDFKKGDLILDKGLELNSYSMALLASQGIMELKVSCQPRIAILTTGDELVEIHEEPASGQLRNSNAFAIELLCRDLGLTDIRKIHVKDNLNETQKALEELSANSDLVFSSGGVSMGEYDFVGQAVEAAGGQIHFWKVRQRPGKPIAFSTLNHTPFLHLPGNPISTMMCFLQYGRVAIHGMMGSSFEAVLGGAILEEDLKTNSELHHFIRGVYREGRVRTTGNQASNLITSLAQANCIIHIPEGKDIIEAGSQVQIELL